MSTPQDSKQARARSTIAGALALSIICSSLTPASAASASNEPIASTHYGDVRGKTEDGIHVFKGIPYGAPTGGVNRFMPPQAPKPWKGMRDALEYGSRCPQISPPSSTRTVEAQPMSEDCLVLNVWTPAVRDEKRRPVMVWFHGGGYSLFSGSSPVYDGVRLAKKGDVVLVTLNHRLNLFGYLFLAPLSAKYADSGNVGQLDLVAALRWVHENIESFGGDPHAVTIFGESGGGGKVATVLAMPAANGLYQRAAMQSGFGLTALTPQAAMKNTNAMLTALNLQASEVDKLRTMPVEQLLEAFQKVTGGSPLGIGPVMDDRSVPRHPFTPDAPAQTKDIPLLVGYNKTETTGLFPPAGAFELDWQGLSKQLAVDLPPGTDVAKVIAGFRRLRPNATPSDLYFVITTEAGMGLNAVTLATRKAAQHAAPVFLYRLEWETPIDGGRLRTPHALDLPLMFDNVAKSPQTNGTATADAQRVADAMSSAWLAFARNGTPNAPGLSSWPAFDPESRSTMVFNVVSRAVDDPLREERLLLPGAPSAPW